MAFHSGEGLVSKHLASYFDLTRQSLISSVLTRLSKNDEKDLHAIQCYDSDDDAWPYGMNTKWPHFNETKYFSNRSEHIRIEKGENMVFSNKIAGKNGNWQEKQ